MGIRLKELGELTPTQVGEAIVGTLATLAPGALLLLLHNQALFDGLSWLQFIVIVLSITMPVVAVHSAAAFLIAPARVTARQCFFIAMCFSFVTLYSAVAVAFWNEISVRETVSMAAAIVGATVLLQSMFLLLLRGRFATWFSRHVLERSASSLPSG